MVYENQTSKNYKNSVNPKAILTSEALQLFTGRRISDIVPVDGGQLKI